MIRTTKREQRLRRRARQRYNDWLAGELVRVNYDYNRIGDNVGEVAARYDALRQVATTKDRAVQRGLERFLADRLREDCQRSVTAYWREQERLAINGDPDAPPEGYRGILASAS